MRRVFRTILIGLIFCLASGIAFAQTSSDFAAEMRTYLNEIEQSRKTIQIELDSTRGDLTKATDALATAQAALDKAIKTMNEYGERMQNNDQYYDWYWELSDQLNQIMGYDKNSDVMKTLEAIQTEINSYKAQIEALKAWRTGLIVYSILATIAAAVFFILGKLKIL
jgi:peptidoglycan hydrolase CwlO-like protein